ncbi:CerR family C-terminal domain-containing protein [Roseomonas chloroacetimidivorans]|uniref:CerR family C-terminal domain-containing protein n=1 Tax=Roseomonas chloroacetimidivorans TaxID=1766656 RepID=UPI003C75708A
MATVTAQKISLRKPRRVAGPAEVPSRGEDARRRILDAAIEEFAAHGYAGGSTRSITARAGVNLGALNYYFDGKPKLYRAVLDHLAKQVEAILKPISETASGALRDTGEDGLAPRQAILAVLDQLLDLLLNRPKIEWDPRWSLLMSRAELEPPKGEPWPFKSLWAVLVRPVAELVARVLGRGAADEECRLTAALFVGQVLTFKTLPAGGLPIMDWKRITGDRRDAIRQVIHGSVNALLDAKAEPRKTSPPKVAQSRCAGR